MKNKEFVYKTYFKLSNPIKDFEEAKNYLKEDNMTHYLKKSVKETDGVVKLVEWVLLDEEKGYIIVISNKILDKIILDKISKWIRGQNSDGLGEGFKSQDFATYRDYNSEDFEDYDFISCQFDWETNDYKLELEN